MSGKLTAFLVLAFAAVCASTSIDFDNPCVDACSMINCPVGGVDVCVQTPDTPTCTTCLTCIASCWACADESNKCNEEEYEKCDSENIKNTCKKTCGLCGPNPSPEPGSGPDICADKSMKCNEKKCKKYSKKKKNKCKKTCGLCEEPDVCPGLKDIKKKKCEQMMNPKKCKKMAKTCKKMAKKCKDVRCRRGLKCVSPPSP